MSEPLYTIEILRLAAETGMTPRLVNSHGSAERRSLVCGSRITVDIQRADDGRIAAYGHDVHACALGQAAATLLARGIVGTTPDTVAAARDRLTAYLAGTSDILPDWPGIAVLARARPYPARHAAVLLPFDAAVAAVADTATTKED